MKTILEDSGKLELDSHAGEKKQHSHPFLGRPEISIPRDAIHVRSANKLALLRMSRAGTEVARYKKAGKLPPAPTHQSGSGATDPPWESRPDLSGASSFRGRNKKGVFLSQFQSHFFSSASSSSASIILHTLLFSFRFSLVAGLEKGKGDAFEVAEAGRPSCQVFSLFMSLVCSSPEGGNVRFKEFLALGF
ncbi:hypothetical protein NL676_014795 [Syzygium grande]|nr:hypothetical protein NL676_014795 [Syzygium grande]